LRKEERVDLGWGVDSKDDEELWSGGGDEEVNGWRRKNCWS
jgi:hypothetical protein